MTPLRDRLTARFYEWEERGRGWAACILPVDPEPEYYPFIGHYLPTSKPTDDGRVRPFISRISDFIFGNEEEQAEEETDIPPVTGYQYIPDEPMTAFAIVVPKDDKAEVADIGRLFLMLSYTNNPMSFEIVATNSSISIQIVCRESDEDHVFAQLRAYCPNAAVTKSQERLEILATGCQTCVIDFGLMDEFMRPLSLASEQKYDPYVGLIATLEHLQRNEQAIVQILFKGAVNPWSESIIRSVMDNKGGPFFINSPEMLKYAQEKISAPLFAVCVKVAVQATKADRAMELCANIGNALMHVSNSEKNRLQILPQTAYLLEDMVDDLLLRESRRLGMILNCDELATLAHFPTGDVHSQKLERDRRKTKAAPDTAQGYEFVLGRNLHHGEEQLVSIPDSLRLRHMHVIGATGTGKSTLLLSMIAQDMQNGNGLSVLDPHGDLIENILQYVPSERIKDVILIDPADSEYPVAFNILSAHSEIEKDILSSDLVAAFKRLSTSWGDQMNSVLANAILAFLENPDGGTLLDLRRFLIEKPFRDNYLKGVSDAHIVYYWQHEYPLLKSNSIGSILTRLDTFLRPKVIRNMVAQKKGLDFEHILDSKKILLVKLSQGLIGAENSYLLGTFFVSKMYQAAMARQAKTKDERNNFFLYIDEFQNFITPSMSHILSGARKYHLGLILAHQDMQQLQKYDTELASSVVVNAGTRICFRLGDTDAKRFASGFSYFDAEDLENLHTGEAIARIEQPKFDFSLDTIPLEEVNTNTARSLAETVIARSREKYGTPREIAERSLPQAPVLEQESEQLTQEPRKSADTFVPVEIPRKESAKKSETEHRYMQTLIKRMAESRGYIAKIEQTTPDGSGRVDVSLTKKDRKIACEVSVTTSDEWEAHNIEKCLAAGYDTVIVCSNDAKNLQRIKAQLAQKLTAEQQAKVFAYNSQEVIQFFDKEVIEESSTEKVMKGYRVKVEFDATTNADMAQMHDDVAKAVTNSMKKKKK